MGKRWILKGKWIITSAEHPPLKNGAILINGNIVEEVDKAEKLEKKYPSLELVDLGEVVIIPSLVNSHTHISMSIFRGIAEDLPLMTWLKEYIFPVEAKLTRDWVYWGAKLSIIEMIKSGTGVFCDMYIFEPEVIRAVKESGLRALLGEGLFDFPSPGYGPLEKGLELTESLLKEFERDSFINIAVSPHTLYTCSKETVKKCISLAEKYQAHLHIHLSENAEEVSVVKERYGKTPIKVMEEIGGLNENLICAHCVKLEEEEVELLFKHKANPVHCPESNLKLGSGIAPISKMIRRGINVCLGTDGPASNNDLDMFSEMRTASLLQKGVNEDPAILSAKDVFKMATENGALALGFEKCGKLRPGFLADLTVVDIKRPELVPDYDPFALLVYSVKAGHISHLMVDGAWIMENYEVKTLNVEETVENVKRIQEEVKKVLQAKRCE